MVDIGVYHKNEEQMDKVLRTILSAQSPNGHGPPKRYGLFAYLYVVVYAKRVQNCCQKHILSNKTQVTVSFNLGQGVIEILLKPNQSYLLDQRKYNVQANK